MPRVRHAALQAATVLLLACACGGSERAPQGAAEGTREPAPSVPVTVTRRAPAQEPKANSADAPAHRFAIVESAETPTARTPDGCVSLELSRKWHHLRYRRGSGADCPHFPDNAELLREMLQAFATYGELASVTSFDVDRDYAVFYTRLAIAAARSPAWDTRRGTASEGSPNLAVMKLASDPSFFPEVTQLFASVGLGVALGSVEKVRAGTPAETPFAAAMTAANVPPHAKIPYDCILPFRLAPAR